MILALLLAAAADPRCSSVKTGDLIACAEAERRGADAALNVAYQAALRAIRAQDGETAPARQANGGLSYSQSLVASEQTWIAYRDAQCRIENYGSWDGHELPIYQRACLTKLTEARTRQLKQLVAPQ